MIKHISSALRRALVGFAHRTYISRLFQMFSYKYYERRASHQQYILQRSYHHEDYYPYLVWCCCAEFLLISLLMMSVPAAAAVISLLIASDMRAHFCYVSTFSLHICLYTVSRLYKVRLCVCVLLRAIINRKCKRSILLINSKRKFTQVHLHRCNI